MATFQMNYLSMKVGMQTNFTVILPGDSPVCGSSPDDFKGQYQRGKKYKVLWLLNSETGDDSEYLKYSGILRYAEKNGLAVVMPCGYNMMYMDEPTGQKFSELITHEQRIICQNYFPFSSKREDNYIGGVSLGAYGALKAALTYPEYYSAALIIDGAFDKDIRKGFLERIQKGMEASGLIPQTIPDETPEEKIEIYETALKTASGEKKLPKIYWAWGSENELTGKDSAEGAFSLQKLGYDVFSKEFKGFGRGWDFWDTALCDAVNEWLPKQSF